MAIYFNDLILEPKEDGNSLQKRYFKERQEVKDLFEKFRKKGSKESYLVFTRDFPKKYNTKKTSYKPAPPIGLPMSANLYDEQYGSVQVRYSPSPPARLGKKVVWPRVDESVIFETLAISENKLDLAWFLLKASGYVKNGILKVVDEKLEHVGDFNKVKKEIDAAQCLFGDNVTLDNLETIATLLFPKGEVISDGDKESLATKLWTYVSAGEKNKKPYNFDALIATAKKVTKAKSEIANQKSMESGENVVTVELTNGDVITVPLLKCPPATTKEKLAAKVEELQIPIDVNQKNDLVYSIVKYYLSLQTA